MKVNKMIIKEKISLIIFLYQILLSNSLGRCIENSPGEFV